MRFVVFALVVICILGFLTEMMVLVVRAFGA